MARKIIETSEAEDQPQDRQKGAIFVKNQTNEVVKLNDGTTYQFRSSREVIADPDLAQKIREVADKYGIFEAQG